jgi:hypothetical protein
MLSRSRIICFKHRRNTPSSPGGWRTNIGGTFCSDCTFCISGIDVQLKAFCAHNDGKLLTISQPFRNEFYSLCKGYAQYGVGQDDMRAQYTSLDAVSAITSSEAFQSATAGSQLKIVVPPLLEILAHSSISLDKLQAKYSLS